MAGARGRSLVAAGCRAYCRWPRCPPLSKTRPIWPAENEPDMVGRPKTSPLWPAIAPRPNRLAEAGRSVVQPEARFGAEREQSLWGEPAGRRLQPPCSRHMFRVACYLAPTYKYRCSPLRPRRPRTHAACAHRSRRRPCSSRAWESTATASGRLAAPPLRCHGWGC